jgi:hypothetical protein
VCVFAGPDERTAPGRLLVSSKHREGAAWGENAAMVLSSEGRLLWYLPSAERIYDVKTVRYRGRTLLALFRVTAPGDGHYELRDERYRLVGRIAMRGHPTDHHELQITDAGTAYIGSYDPVTVPGGGRVLDYVMQEIDLRSRRVLFEWRALDHVPVSASYMRRPGGARVWDYFHGNSIEPPTPDDPTIVVSARNTSAVYGIDRRTGAVRWILGGKQDQFGLVSTDPGALFCTQHDARRLPGGDLLVFDNGGAGKTFGTGCPPHPARVLRFGIDLAEKSARVVWSVGSREAGGTGRELFPIALGSSRQLPNGNALISWGTTGQITEVTQDGTLVHGLRLPGSTYRAVREPWVGRPSGRPAVVARRGAGDRIDVWASWNGATEIAAWQVLAAGRGGRLEAIGPPARFVDLETHVRVRARASRIAVRALDAGGRALGRSRVVALEPDSRRRPAAERVDR